MDSASRAQPADQADGSPRTRPGLLALVFGLAYLALSAYAAELPSPARYTPYIAPADGLALGAYLVSRRARWPAIAAIILACTLAIGVAFGLAWGTTATEAFQNVVAPLFVAAALLAIAGARVRIDTLLGMGAFLVNLVPLVAVIAFSVAITQYLRFGSSFREQWSVTFVSAYVSLIIFGPLILAWTQGGGRSSRGAVSERTAELAVLFAGMVLATHFVFSLPPKQTGYAPAFAYLCPSFLIWAALRFGLRSSTLCLTVFALLCHWHTVHGTGPFAPGGRADWTSMLHLQGYIATVVVTTLFASALLAERESAAKSTEAWRLRHEAAIRASGNLLYELDPVSGTVLWDGDTRAVLGVAHDRIATVHDWLARVHPDDRVRLRGLRRKFISGELSQVTMEYRVKRGEDGWITVGVNGYAIDDPTRRRRGRHLVIGFVSDVSERIRAEAERAALAAQLKQAEKMEAVGHLAGGIAHDFNNILGAILGYGELAQGRAKDDPQLRRYLDTIVGAGNRAKSLVSQILAYSRADGGIQSPVIVGSVAREVCDLLRGSSSASVDIRFTAPPDDAMVMGDPTRLHQLLMNLASNAMQAMPGGGVLEVTVTERRLEAPVKTRLSGVAPGDYLAIEVKDTGQGIAPGVIDRIFEPFFTTKPAGRGTGLGLALVHTIVKEHGGAIDVASEVGKGTTFTVWLPHLMQEGAAPAAEAAEEVAPGRGQVVLAVDDEPEVLAALEEMLATLGYEPAGYTDSRAALEAFRADPGRFEAVVSDEVMPQLTGTQLAVELRKLNPAIPIVIATGYGGAGFETRALSAGVNRVLKKPYRMQQVGDVLRGFFGPG